MPLFDFVCQNPECRIEQIDVLEPSGAGRTIRFCRVCGREMERKAASGSFAVKGYNAANGYSGGQQ